MSQGLPVGVESSSGPRPGASARSADEGPLPLRVMIDFDGTLVAPNVAILLVEEFAPDGKRVAHEIDQLLHSGQIGLREAWQREVALLPPQRLPEMARFVREQVPLRQGARDFVSLMRAHGVDLRVLSGGLEFFIREVLARERLDLPVFADQLVVQPSGRAEVVHPFGHATCRLCGICKAGLVARNGGRERTVFIADGSTDRYGAEVADIVFARHRLLAYCRTSQIPCFAFEDFRPVTEQFRRWLDGAEPLPPYRSRGLGTSLCPISRGLVGADL